MPRSGTQSNGWEKMDANSAVPVPSMALPKVGGAVKGFGKKYAANPLTGTGRSGFGSHQNRSYDSVSSNGVPGLSWSFSFFSITRKADKVSAGQEGCQDGKTRRSLFYLAPVDAPQLADCPRSLSRTSSQKGGQDV